MSAAFAGHKRCSSMPLLECSPSSTTHYYSPHGWIAALATTNPHSNSVSSSVASISSSLIVQKNYQQPSRRSSSSRSKATTTTSTPQQLRSSHRRRSSSSQVQSYSYKNDGEENSEDEAMKMHRNRSSFHKSNSFHSSNPHSSSQCNNRRMHRRKTKSEQHLWKMTVTVLDDHNNPPSIRQQQPSSASSLIENSSKLGCSSRRDVPSSAYSRRCPPPSEISIPSEIQVQKDVDDNTDDVLLKRGVPDKIQFSEHRNMSNWDDDVVSEISTTGDDDSFQNHGTEDFFIEHYEAIVDEQGEGDGKKALVDNLDAVIAIADDHINSNNNADTPTDDCYHSNEDREDAGVHTIEHSFSFLSLSLSVTNNDSSRRFSSIQHNSLWGITTATLDDDGIHPRHPKLVVTAAPPPFQQLSSLG